LSERIVLLPQLQVRGLTNTPSEEFNKHIAIDDPTYCTLRTMLHQLKILDVCKTKAWAISTCLCNSTFKGARGFFLLQNRPDRRWGPACLLYNGQVRRPGRQGYYSPRSGGEVTNEWSCTSVPIISLSGMDRDKIVFITGNYEDLIYPENGGTKLLGNIHKFLSDRTAPCAGSQ
jgi:hypothetical protein